MRRIAMLITAAALATTGCGDKKGPSEPQPAPATPEPTTTTPAPAEPAPPQSTVEGEEVTYTAGDTTLKGYLAYDESQSGPRPGVLVVHEWWGHNQYARDRARQLAGMGYTALALDMYGDGKNTTHPEDAMKFSQEVGTNLDVAVDRFEAARTLLAEHPTTDPDKIAAIGYCFGGGVVLHMVRVGIDLDAVAIFHGSLAPMSGTKAKAFAGKVLVFHGADDPFVKPEVVDAFKKEMADAGIDMEFTAYPGAVHSFTNPAATEVGKQNNLPLRYDKDADDKSWAAMTAGFDAVFR